MTSEQPSRFWQFIDDNWKTVVRTTFVVLFLVVSLALYAISTQM